MRPGATRTRSQLRSRVRQDRRLRVLLFGHTRGLAEPEGRRRAGAARLAPLALLALSERMRGGTPRPTVAYLQRAGVEVKVISGDGPATVAAVARAAGIDTAGRVTTGAELPQEGLGAAPEPRPQHRLRPRSSPSTSAS